MRSERVPFTDGETPFPNHAQGVLSSFGDIGDARGGSEVADDGIVTSGDVPDTSDADVGSADADSEVADYHEVCQEVTGPHDDQEYAYGPEDNIDILYKWEGSESAGDGIGSADADPLPPYAVDVLPEGIEVIDGIAYIRQEPVVRRQVLVRVNRAFKDRLKVIAVLERRDMTAVVEEAIRVFLSEPVNEPRPYLPSEFDETQTCRLTFYLNSDQEVPLRDRARMERREVMDLVRRALVDYMEASLFDPKPKPPIPYTGETHGNGPRRHDDSSEVSEYQEDGEVRLTPFKAQRTGCSGADGVIG